MSIEDADRALFISDALEDVDAAIDDIEYSIAQMESEHLALSRALSIAQRERRDLVIQLEQIGLDDPTE